MPKPRQHKALKNNKRLQTELVLLIQYMQIHMSSGLFAQ